MLFQNTTLAALATASATTSAAAAAAVAKGQLARKLVLQEAALCCSMSHPNVVATYDYDVLVASAFRDSPSGLRIADNSGEGAFKLYLIQVGLRVPYARCTIRNDQDLMEFTHPAC